MSNVSRGINKKKHKSIEDKKNASIAGAVKKVGGQKEADDLQWEMIILFMMMIILAELC